MGHPTENELRRWLRGELAPREAALIEAHTAQCDLCAARYAELLTSGPLLKAPPALLPGVLKRLPARPAPAPRPVMTIPRYIAAAVAALVLWQTGLLPAASDKLTGTLTARRPDTVISAGDTREEARGLTELADKTAAAIRGAFDWDMGKLSRADFWEGFDDAASIQK